MFYSKIEWVSDVKMEITGSIYSFYKCYFISMFLNLNPCHIIQFNVWQKDINFVYIKIRESYEKNHL